MKLFVLQFFWRVFKPVSYHYGQDRVLAILQTSYGNCIVVYEPFSCFISLRV